MSKFPFICICLFFFIGCNYTPSDPERDLRVYLLQTANSFDAERFIGCEVTPVGRIHESFYATRDSSTFRIKGFSDAQNSSEIHFTRGEDPSGKMLDVIFRDLKAIDAAGLLGVDGMGGCLYLYIKKRINGKRWIVGKCDGGETDPLFDYPGNQDQILQKLDSVWYFFPTLSYNEYESFP